MLVTLLTSELTITSAREPPLRPRMKAKMRLPIPVQYGITSVPENSAFEALGAQNFQPPDHQERRDDEQRQKQPRRIRPFGLNPMDERVQHATESNEKFSTRDIEINFKPQMKHRF